MNEHEAPVSILSRVPFWAFVAVVPVIAALAIALTGFGAGNDATASSSTGDAIAIKDFTFSPDPITVPVGMAITVINRDGAAHTLTAKRGAFDTGDIAGGDSGSLRIDRPGTYAYFCEIHQYMEGTLTAA